MNSPVQIKYDGAVAVVQIDNPPVNALSQSVRAGIVAAVEQTDTNTDIRAIILICNGSTFMAGADVKEFGKPPVPPLLPDVITALEAAQKPWIAAIHGTALGGGLEVALGCHYRIAANSTKFGLPEVNLGLIPGAGGTVRLPRLVPMAEAFSMTTSGKPISAAEAHSIGLVDMISDGDLLRDALSFAETIIDQPKPDALSARQVKNPFSDDEIQAQLKTVSSKARGQLSPKIAAETLIANQSLDAEAGLALERDNFLRLKDDPQSEALRYIFFAERSVSKIGSIKNTVANPVEKVGIIGGGTMGAGIAASCLLAGLNVTMIERDAASLAAGVKRVETILQSSMKRGLISQAQYDTFNSNLSGNTQFEELSDADFVIEAVFEDMAVKKDVFAKLDAAVKPDAILASNTSYLDMNELAAATAHPERVIGLHFFSPAHIMKLVEVIRTDQVSDIALATSMAFAKKLRKLAVPAGVCDGFIGNRIMSAYRRAAEYMLEDGALPHEIDAAMKSYGFAMGLFEMQDLAGLDIGYAMRRRKDATRDPHERYVDIADKIYNMGRSGRKTGAGFYRYEDGKTPRHDPEIDALIIGESERKEIDRKPMSHDEIMAGIIGAMAQEGRDILNENIAASPQSIDVVMVNGYGFPRWRGGPMYQAEQNA
ncbi:3-hydroxyacyl-CoA dehydrogenase NAD-binding domain-containing protein [Ahrensia marina]|uniref:3-hydroxyacyl-CoA dehydrogenase n=1 Tax=Ahrensia marina TaxID=1514904 RepID=A0A0N0VLZ8_9HYPH|nr:3-hydroxyacyl-CoA dehydrogenase NAD-binding domain-containing protein [Ahrensia marina]KPB01838.1 3-hydroxyacyl-CoA dehydrogenase [Ahrensia marina]